MSDVVIAGNSLAALTAAVQLSKARIPCTIVNPTPHWGGYFNGQNLYGQHFDLGMVLYEFTSFNDQEHADVLSFNTNVRNDCGRFTSHIENFVHEFITTQPVSAPQMIFRDKVYEDLEQSNKFEVLRGGLTAGEQEVIQEELRASLQQKMSHLHARHKLSSYYDELDYETAAFYNHGPTLHNLLISPIARKITGARDSEFLARWHRVAWTPLFYPETLLSQWSDSPQCLNETVFSFPTEGDAGALPRAIMNQLRRDPSVTLIQQPIKTLRHDNNEFRLELQDGTVLSTNKMAWSAQHASLLEATGNEGSDPEFNRTSLALALISVPSELVGHRSHTLFIVDEDTPVYRIFNHDICVNNDSAEHRMIAEVNAEFADWDMDDEETVKKILTEDLQKKGVLKAPVSADRITLIHLKKALTLPTRQNQSLFEQQLNAIRQLYPSLALLSPAGGFFISSMNNQIIAGLQFARQVELGLLD